MKAYEARRAAEAQRLNVPIPAQGSDTLKPTVRRTGALSRSEEFQIIKADLRRLLLILVVLAVILIAATFVLR